MQVKIKTKGAAVTTSIYDTLATSIYGCREALSVVKQHSYFSSNKYVCVYFYRQRVCVCASVHACGFAISVDRANPLTDENDISLKRG